MENTLTPQPWRDSVASTLANPPSVLASEDATMASRGHDIGVLERHREELTTRGLLTPTVPAPARLRPALTFDIAEPPTPRRHLGTTLSTAFGLMRGRTRLSVS